MNLRNKLTLIAVFSALAVTAPGVAWFCHFAADQFLQSSIVRLSHETRQQAAAAGSALRRPEPYAGSEHFLIDRHGNYLLAGHWQPSAATRSAGFKPDLSAEPQLKALLESRQTGGNGARVLIGGQDFLGFSQATREGRYYRLVPVDQVMAPMHQLILYAALLLAGTGLLAAMLMHAATGRLVARPFRRLAEAVHVLGEGLQLPHGGVRGAGEMRGNPGMSFDDLTDRLGHYRHRISASEKRYHAIVESIREVVFQIDAEGRFVFLSPNWQTLSGHGPEACLGQTLWDCLDERDRESARSAFDAMAKGERLPPCTAEYRLQSANGSECWVEMLIQPAPDDTGMHTGTLNDITLRRQTQLLEAMYHDLGQLALHGTSPVHISDLVALKLGRIFNCQTLLVNVRHGKPTHLSACGISIPEERILNLPAAHLNATLRLEEFPPPWRTLAEEHGIRSAVAVSLGNDAEKPGRIVFMHPAPDAIAPGTLSLMESTAERVRVLLQTAHDQEWLHLVSSALKTTANAIFIARADGVIEWGNAALFQLTGYEQGEIVGNTPRMLNSGTHPAAFWQKFWDSVRSGQAWQQEVVNRRKDGALYTVRQTVTPILDALDSITHFISVQEDISQIKETEEQLRHNATHDLLTGLPNRALMLEQLKQALHTAQRNQGLIGILFIDLDRFKIINDSLGHHAGDELLRQVTARLSATLRKGDTLARQGGDEFVVVLPGISSPLHAAVVAKKMLDSLLAPVTLAGHELTIGCSIGISLYPTDGESADVLLKNSDTAMYNAKESGRNNFRFYVPEMNVRVVKRMELESDLRRALARQEFELHYQPQVEIGTGRIVGVEALMRWQHPQRGMVLPAEFVPVAEDTGLIVPIGDWALLTACQQLRDWREAGLPPLSMAVNVSARQFRHEIILIAVKKALTETGIDPGMLELEITESLMMEHADTHTAILHRLHDLGVRLALDDFGTGFSSLSYLKRLPFDALKIDRTFVEDIGVDADDTAIAVSIVGLAHNLGVKAIAEGVETVAQRDFLHRHGCDYEQGFLFSRPLPAAELATLLRSSAEKPLLGRP